MFQDRTVTPETARLPRRGGLMLALGVCLLLLGWGVPTVGQETPAPGSSGPMVFEEGPTPLPPLQTESPAGNAPAMPNQPSGTPQPAGTVPSSGTPSSSGTTPATAPASPNLIPQDILYLPDAEGRLKPVPVNVTLEQYLDWLDQRTSQAGEDQAEWAIRSLETTGELKTAANGQPWAQLNCKLMVETRQSLRWHSLPLMMGEGLLAGLTDADQATAASQLMVTRDSDSGQWLLWYRNRKSFTVTIELLVPIRVTGDENQLQLTLPASSRTELQLQLPRNDLQVELQSRGFWEQETTEAGILVRIAGFQQGIDLRWSPQREESERAPILHVDTQMEVGRSQESNLLTARQKVTLDRGSISSVRVKLPAGFQVDGVSADVPMKYAIEASDPSAITLNFMQSIQTAVQIDWKLSAPIRRFESQLQIEGFSVAGARTQTGKIGVQKSSQWRIVHDAERSENVFLMNLRDFPASGDFLLAFRYYGQPYRLVLNAQRSEFQFNHSAFYQVLVDRESLKLTVDFEITPRNGAIDSIRLDWPDLNAGFWIPEKIVRQSTGKPIVWQIESDNKLLLPLPEMAGPEVIRLEASRRIPRVSQLVNDHTRLSLVLPHVSTTDSAVLDRVLRVCNSHYYPWETQLIAERAELYPPRSVPEDWSRRSVYQQKNADEQRVHWYRLLQAGDPVDLTFNRVEQEIKARSSVRLQHVDIRHRQIEYTQQLEFQVSQLPLEKLQLLQQIAEQQQGDQLGLRFTDEFGTELNPIITPLPASYGLPLQSGGSDQSVLNQQLEFTPKSPVLGRYVLNIQRKIALPTAETLEQIGLELPLLQFPEMPQMQNQFRNESAYLVELTDPDWQMTDVTDGVQVWSSPQTVPRLKARLNLQRTRLASGAGRVEAEVQSWLSGSGALISEMRFQMAQTPPTFELRNDGEHVLLSAQWADASSGNAHPIQILQQSEHNTLLFPEPLIGRSGRLTLSVRHASQPALTSLRNLRLSLPEHSLAGDVSLVTWNLHVPQGMYLWGAPAGVNACYHWAWRGLGLRRVPTSPVAERMTEAARPATGTAPSYSFSSVGWPETLQLRLIGRGLLMTFGTGLPLLIAVVFAGRSVADRLRGGVIVAAVLGAFAVLLPETFLVLLQPALLGTACILGATALAGLVRSRQEEPTLIIIGPTLPGEVHSSQEVRFSDHGIGADDITRVQPPRQSVLESSHP